MFKTEQRGQTSLYNISYHPQHMHRFSVFIVITESSRWHCSGFYLPALVCCCLLYISLHLRLCLLHGNGWHHHYRLQHYEYSLFLLHLLFQIFLIIQVGGVWCSLIGIGLWFPWAFGYMSLPLVFLFLVMAMALWFCDFAVPPMSNLHSMLRSIKPDCTCRLPGSYQHGLIFSWPSLCLGIKQRRKKKQGCSINIFFYIILHGILQHDQWPPVFCMEIEFTS